MSAAASASAPRRVASSSSAATGGVKSDSAESQSNKGYTLRISGAESVLGTTYYIIVIRDRSDDRRWTSWKRYSSFETLHNVILDVFGTRVSLPVGCELPPKRPKLLIAHEDNHFVEERRCLLEAYLRKLLSVPEIAKSDIIREFLNSDVKRSAASSSSSAASNGHRNGDDQAANIHDLADEEEWIAPDDYEITHVSIPATRTMSDHSLYQVDVQNLRKRKSFSKWTVLKRFSQFFEMDEQLRAELQTGTVPNSERLLSVLPSPPVRYMKLFTDHLDENFVEHRRILLENYLRNMLKNRYVGTNKIFLRFLGVNV